MTPATRQPVENTSILASPALSMTAPTTPTHPTVPESVHSIFIYQDTSRSLLATAVSFLLSPSVVLTFMQAVLPR